MATKPTASVKKSPVTKPVAKVAPVKTAKQAVAEKFARKPSFASTTETVKPVNVVKKVTEPKTTVSEKTTAVAKKPQPKKVVKNKVEVKKPVATTSGKRTKEQVIADAKAFLEGSRAVRARKEQAAKEGFVIEFTVTVTAK